MVSGSLVFCCEPETTAKPIPLLETSHPTPGAKAESESAEELNLEGYCMIGAWLKRLRKPAFALLLAWTQAAAALAQDPADDEEVVLKDNSFLVEEAYNQEPGVVQHIFNWVPSWDRNYGVGQKNFDFVFTQEWPLGSQTHQFSYTIPFISTIEHSAVGERSEVRGLGDIFLHYRLQVLDGEDEPFAFAPRFSLIMPSGDESLGLGHEHLGYQVNLPLSMAIERWAFHFNAGATFNPGVRPVFDPAQPFPFDGRALNGYNLGGSAVYFLKPNFHVLVEAVQFWDEDIRPDGGKENLSETIVLPGLRWAPYTKGDTQWVLGLGLPIGVSRDAADVGVFFYMSFEHRFAPERE